MTACKIIPGLPPAIAAAVANDPYDDDGADISVTRLVAPPRMVALVAKHGGIPEDPEECIYRLAGQAVHAILERAAQGLPNAVVERRWAAEVLGWKLTGASDVYMTDTYEVHDYKFSALASFADGPKPEYIQQLNVLAWLIRSQGYRVSRLVSCPIYRDWAKLRASKSQNYQQHASEMWEVPLWNHKDQMDYVYERVRAHQDARRELPECTADDRWQKPEQWAVMKRGRKRAIKLCNSEQSALDYWESLPAPVNHYAERRRSEPIRCKLYCGARHVCTQGQQLVETQNEEN